MENRELLLGQDEIETSFGWDQARVWLGEREVFSTVKEFVPPKSEFKTWRCFTCVALHHAAGLRESGGTFLGEPTNSYLIWLNILVQFPYGRKNLGFLHRYLHRRVSL